MPLAFFDLPQDPALCPGDALSAGHLRQLLRAALPDKGRHKAAGWFGQTDFLLTRSHVDEDQDAYHDALFITLWKRWDFWIALPAHAPGRPLARAWARLRGAATPAAPAAPDTLECQYRRHDGTGRPGPWLPLDAQAPPEALQACTEGWHGVLRYWRLAEAQRRAGRPLRARLHALLTPARVEALTRLPVFTGQRIDGWEGEAWACTLQPHPHGGCALRLDWRNGDGAPEDTRASYQIDRAEGAGTAHPPGLRISYRQREGDALELLPNDAVEHMDRLLRLFAAVERQPPDAQTADGPLPALPRTPPFAPHESDTEVFGPALTALSRDWQAAGRAHAAVVREHWAAQPEDGPPPLADPRGLHAAAVLHLARTVHALADAGLSERFHHRFAFAPGAYARHASRHGQHVHALRWQPDGSLLAWTDRCWRVSADGLRITPAEGDPPLQDPPPRAALHGTAVHGDARGNLLGLAEDGRALWHHHVGGGAVLCIAPGPGDTLAVGTAGGTLALLRRAGGPDPSQYGTSRYAEARRILFWTDGPAPLAW
jgi:hypothetical protein